MTEETNKKITGIVSGLFFIGVGITALLNPDMFEDYEALGRYGLIKMLLQKVWGSVFGWIALALGVLALIGTFVTQTDVENKREG